MNITFNNEFKKSNQNSNKTTTIGRLFIKLSGGKIKTQQQANTAILIITVIIFIATFYFIFFK